MVPLTLDPLRPDEERQRRPRRRKEKKLICVTFFLPVHNILKRVVLCCTCYFVALVGQFVEKTIIFFHTIETVLSTVEACRLFSAYYRMVATSMESRSHINLHQPTSRTEKTERKVETPSPSTG